MHRRTLLQLTLAGTALLVAPRTLLAAGPADPFASPFAGALFYTQDAPGRWAGKEASHAPLIERTGNAIEVVTPHEMDGFDHYIVKHIILDEDFAYRAEVLFDPTADMPVSRHDIGALANVVYAVSLCNKHDAWISALRL